MKKRRETLNEKETNNHVIRHRRIIAASVPAFAETQVISRETEHYPDGSYAVIETVIFENTAVPFAAASTKSASRTYTFHRADGKAAWDFTLTGTFTYNGTTAKATKAATSYKVYISGWTCTKNQTVSGAVQRNRKIHITNQVH